METPKEETKGDVPPVDDTLPVDFTPPVDDGVGSGAGGGAGAGTRADTTSDEIKVVTYNVLSPQCCDNIIFDRCKAEDLDGKTRWKRTAKLLTQWMKEKRIICLQELDDNWAASFAVHFDSSGYHLLSAQYSGGKLGVGIAYPRDTYKLTGHSIFNVGMAYYKICIDGLPLSVLCRRSVSDNFSTIEINSIVKQLNNGSYRDNRCISVKLQLISNPDKEFWVSTYHMPCKYDQPTLMHAHIVSFMSHLNKLSGELPLILAGDFNVVPDSDSYKIMTERIVPDKLKKLFKYSSGRSYPFRLATDAEYNPEVRLVMFSSAWADLNGKEPAFTNIKITRQNTFVDTLDYILYKGLTVSECCFDSRTIDYTGTMEGLVPYPTDRCPSDHVPMLSTFVYTT